MDTGSSDQLPEPIDQPVDELAGESSTGDGADTEGHSMLTIELARTMTNERVRDGERMSRDAARAREGRPARDGGGLLGRLRRR